MTATATIDEVVRSGPPVILSAAARDRIAVGVPVSAEGTQEIFL